MCLAIPGQIVEVVDEQNRLARWTSRASSGTSTSASSTTTTTAAPGPGDWVLIHVGFALSKVDEEEALATRKMLEAMGEDYEQELEELKSSLIE